MKENNISIKNHRINIRIKFNIAAKLRISQQQG